MSDADQGTEVQTPVIDPAAVTTTPADESAPEGSSPDKARPIQPRINELVRQREEAKREADYWKQRATAQAEPEKKDEPAPKPQADKFESYDEYVEALADWKADQKIDQKLKARDEQAVQSQTRETRASNWSKSVEAAKQVHADYDDVMSASDVPIADHVKELLLDNERGAELAYHLDRNPQLATELNDLTPTQAARKLGLIEAGLTAPAAPSHEQTAGDEPPVTPPRKTTAAPPPAKPAPAGRSTTVSPEKMSMDDYVKHRKSQGATWARR